jgi:hypothetical protein
MAIWQYDFLLIPEFGMIQHHGTVPERIDSLFIDSEEEPPAYWSDFDQTQKIEKEASILLGQLKSWSDEARMFGTEDGNKIEIWDDEIHCRFDLRTPDLEVLESILRIARQAKCFVISNFSHLVIEPDLKKVCIDIKESPSYKFCKDPKSYLGSLAQTNSEPGESGNG